MEASPPSPARKPPTGKKKKSDSPGAKAKRMERYRNDSDVQELLAGERAPLISCCRDQLVSAWVDCHISRGWRRVMTIV